MAAGYVGELLDNLAPLGLAKKQIEIYNRGIIHAYVDLRG